MKDLRRMFPESKPMVKVNRPEPVYFVDKHYPDDPSGNLGDYTGGSIPPTMITISRSSIFGPFEDSEDWTL